jgi:aminoglycoside phosphotransferase (APT) family kinase protein
VSDRSIHIPGLPITPEPPEGLVEIANSMSHPDVTRVGLTATSDGRWALMVRVRPETPTPVEGVEEICREYPVIYQEEPGELPVARPAYPALGE